MKTIGKHIEDAIASGKAESLADIARRLHVEKSTVTRWARGSNTPSGKEAVALADLLGLPADLLFAECDLARETDPAARAVRQSIVRFLRQAKSTAALVIMGTGVVLYTTAPEKAFANQGVARTEIRVIQIIAALRKFLRAALAEFQKPSGTATRWRGLAAP